LFVTCSFLGGGYIAGYSFFNSGDVELLGRRKKSAHSDVGCFFCFSMLVFCFANGIAVVVIGKVIPLAEY
jgi:hypothetical protein